MKKIITTAVILLGLTSIANAQTSNLTASAQVISPLSLVSVTAINWGDIITGSSSTVYSLDSSDTITVSSGDGTFVAGTASTGAATLNGQPNNTVNITVDASSTLTNGASTLTATFTSDQAGIQTLSGTGDLAINIYGDLTVPSTAVTGVYNGTYVVTYSY